MIPAAPLGRGEGERFGGQIPGACSLRFAAPFPWPCEVPDWPWACFWPGWAAPHESGVTAVQSIVASVASFMWATHDTNAPWFENPAGVSIWAAAETRAPW